ncbi:hypothetical protein PMAYCL1PPCAC_24399, partial [Pristionchus mayeri]
HNFPFSDMVRLSPLLLIISLCVVLNAASVAQRLHNHPYFVGQSYLGGMTPLIQENSILDYTKQDLQWLARFPMDKLYQYQNRGWVGGRRK